MAKSKAHEQPSGSSGKVKRATKTAKSGAHEAALPVANTRLVLAPPVNWSLVAPLGYALARIGVGGRLDAFEHFLRRITEPLRRLDQIHLLAQRAFDGAPSAAQMLCQLLARPREPSATPQVESTPTCDCCANPAPPSAAQKKASPAPKLPGPVELLDETAVTQLMAAVARLQGPQDAEALNSALDALMDVVNSAALASELVRAVQREGANSVGRVLENRLTLLPLNTLELLRFPAPAAPVLTTMSFSGPALPGMPQLPGLPGTPQLPGQGGLEDLFPKREIDLILERLRHKKILDPEQWDPPFIIARDYAYVDYWNLPFFRCIRAARALFQHRAAIKPPVPPSPVTWATGIAAVKASGPCAGASVVIRGSGLAIPDSVLLVPFADGCHAVPVDPTKWTSTSIQFSLPAGAISGPVGFGNGPYIQAYDAWASEQNRLADQIRAMGCLAPDMQWVSPFRQCPSDTGVNRFQVGSAVIDAFAANGEGQLVLEADALVTLTWEVRNAVEVRIRRIGAVGPSPSPTGDAVNPAGTSLSLGAVTASAPTSMRYQLIAKGPCGTVTRDVEVVVSRRPRLVIESVEVTQGIQTVPHSVTLVAGKPVVVRVTVRHGLNGFSNNLVSHVRGRIRVRYQGGGGSATWIDAANGTSSPMMPNPAAEIAVVLNPKRSNTNDTLNFYIATQFTNITCRFDIEVRVEGFGSVGGFAGFNEQTTLTTGYYSFETRRHLEIRYGRVNWNGSGAPTDAECINAINRAVAILPTPGANIQALPIGVVTGTGGTSTGTDVNLGGKIAVVRPQDDAHNCDWFESLMDFLFGNCPDDDHAIWVFVTGTGVFIGGWAANIPGNTLISDQTPIIMAHELAHCLNQRHVNVCGANGGDAGSLWNNGVLNDVAFDAFVGITVVDGTGVSRELMTYCGGRWPAPLRWSGLFGEIGP